MPGLPRVGDVYGKFRISSQLGRGGMGAVYEATDTVLGRQVALKVMLPTLADTEDFKRRFAREAAALARVRSRHIVQIHEYGEHDGTLFLVTELIPDGDLHRWLSTHGPMAVPDALRLLEQLSEGLIDAHAVGVIHRDIKPSNVLLWLRGGSLIPYICDFGIASDGETGLTQAGSLIGSFGYMAPERFVGQPVDERGDIYALGCLLWTLVTGRLPYGGTDFQMMAAHRSEPVPQLPVTGIEDQVVNDLLRRAMAKEPRDRFATASSLRHDLLAAIELAATTDAGEFGQQGTVIRPWWPGVEPDHVSGHVDKTPMVRAKDDSDLLATARIEATVPSLPPSARQGLWFGTAAGLAAAVLVSVAFAVIHLSGSEQDDDGIQGSIEEPDAMSQGKNAAAPNAALDRASPSTPSGDPVACWNGVHASAPSDCAAPVGAEGLEFVFPSMDQCPKISPSMVEKEEVYVCEYDTFSLRYSRWNIDFDRFGYMDQTSAVLGVDWQIDGHWAGLQWTSYQPDEEQPFRWAAAYAVSPYSVSVEASTASGRATGIAKVEARPPSDIGVS